MQIEPIKVTSFEELQSLVRSLRARADACQETLSSVQIKTGRLNIFRPLKTFLDLRVLQAERDTLAPQVRDIVRELGRIVFITPDKNMGQTLTSCLDSIRLSSRMTNLQTQWIEVDSGLQQTGAFAFGIFALYVSAVSLFVTVVLGLLPFVLKLD